MQSCISIITVRSRLEKPGSTADTCSYAGLKSSTDIELHNMPTYKCVHTYGGVHKYRDIQRYTEIYRENMYVHIQRYPYIRRDDGTYIHIQR